LSATSGNSTMPQTAFRLRQVGISRNFLYCDDSSVYSNNFPWQQFNFHDFQLNKYWNDERRTEINLQREEISNLQRRFNKDSLDEKELSIKLKEQETKHATKARITFWRQLMSLCFSNVKSTTWRTRT
jgi:hypothetical protein